MQSLYSIDPDIINEVIQEDEYNGDQAEEELQDKLEQDEIDMYSGYSEIY